MTTRPKTVHPVLLLALLMLLAAASFMGSTAGGQTLGPATQPASIVAAPVVPVYSWSDWQIPGVTPMVWVELTKDPIAQAEAIAAKARGPPTTACPPIFIWHPESRALLSGTLLETLTGVYHHEASAAWSAQFFGRLYDLGLRPPLIVLDYEGGVTNWQITRAAFDTIPKAKLPAEIRGLSSDALFRTLDRASVNAYNAFAVKVRNDALRKAFVVPAKAAFGQPAQGGYELQVCNYGDTAVAGLPDLNGWPSVADTVDGWSAPRSYLGGDGQRYAGRSYIDGRYADAVAAAQACRSVSAQLAPWVSYPLYAGDGVPDSVAAADRWMALVPELRKSAKVLLFWNPRPPAGDEAARATKAFSRP